MPNYNQKFGGHTAITMTAGAKITGGQALKMSNDNTVEPCTAGAVFAGIAGQDAEKGSLVTVHYSTVGFLEMTDAVRAGEYVKTAAAGKGAKAAAANEAGVFGLCLAAGSSTAPALVRMGI